MAFEFLHPTGGDALDPDLPPLDQIVERIERGILDGRLPPGSRLPTIRRASEVLGVPRSTVQQAYRRLADAGLVEATVGRGTEVRRSVEAGARGEPDAPGGPRPDGLGPRAQAVLSRLADLSAATADLPTPDPGAEVVANFRDLLPDSGGFPVEPFANCLREVLAARGTRLLAYGDPQGDPELRAWLGAESGRPAREVLVTNGAQQGIDLVLRALTAPGDAVVATAPTYSQLAGSLAAHGLELRSTSWRWQGTDLAELEPLLMQPSVRLLYVMPSFQNPTGSTMDLDTRHRLLELCARGDVYVLEDDFEGRLRFEGEDVPSLGELAPERVATVRTFSKGLFPGIRLGWITAPERWIEAMTALRRFTDLETSPLTQAALLEFARQGHVGTHLERTRDELRRRHRCAQEALARWMPPGVEWSRPAGGFAIWVELPTELVRGGLDAEQITRLAADDGVLITPATLFDPTHARASGFRICLSQTPEDCITKGIRVLARHCAGPRAARRPAPLIL